MTFSKPAFYENIVFHGAAEDSICIEPEAAEELLSWGVTTQTFVPGNPAIIVPSGPYIVMDGKTWQPWRMSYDFNACFMRAFRPAQKAGGIALETSQGGINGRVIVPSRCYFTPSKSRPLDGARISVKDSIDIKGHKTTLCNRAWADLYSPVEEDAACVKTLVSAGAIIIGKVKLQAMIMREEPLECVEFTAPFNPRGDGYQVPSRSSHRIAAGISSYNWLDFSLWSDTNGRCRKPAAYNGRFAIRPTTNIMDTTGVVAFFPEFDMPALFGRNTSKFPEALSVWYGDSSTLRDPTKAAVKILYPTDYLLTSNPAQSCLLEEFLWKEDCPDGKDHDDVAKYLEAAGTHPFIYDQYHILSSFRDRYEKKFGNPPFVHRALRRCTMYRERLLTKIFNATSEDMVSVMALPIETRQPNYRDSPLPPYGLLSGFNPLHMSPIMRAPEVTAPVGDIPNQSIVTKREEPRPIAVSLIGPPGTDLMLVELVEEGMEGADLPVEVKTGRFVF
ncbi:amidase signature enzyme [Ophiobolus disseminans]|uniref:Amidase signature enzyme n=1 Tax=Ophiobolus disseminans TaxID=1469910 RepID=A0A6A6ZDW9_9PLEO|nr:amidase signature enzyme [Ophiobolus disseminans]